MRPTLLVIDDSAEYCSALDRALATSYRVGTAQTAAEAIARSSPAPDMILLDLRLDPHSDSEDQAQELLRYFVRELPETPVLIITAYGDVDRAVECMRLGAADFVEKGKGTAELKVRLERALERAQLASRVQQLEAELAVVEPRELIGKSAALAQVKELIAGVARDGQVTVLVTGETGTGKELVARAVHASGARASRPFAPVAIAALPPSTLESELFGHEKGAFTDAKRRHIGVIERAQGGVLFLDEIAELAQGSQVKLLRFLEERVITRLGGEQEIAVDVQVIAATNAVLKESVANGRLREDLYYRLRVCEIHLAPLRERREDVPLLVEHFVSRLGRSRGVVSQTAEAMECFMACDWPGNIRELRNAVEAAVLRAGLRRSTQIAYGDLPEEMRGGGAVHVTQTAGSEGPMVEPLISLPEALARAELEQVERALRASGGRKSEAWKVLGLNDRFALTRRVKRIVARFPALAANYPNVQEAFLVGSGKGGGSEEDPTGLAVPRSKP